MCKYVNFGIMYNRIRRGDLFPYHPHGCRDFWVEELKGRLSKIRYHTINTVLRLRGGGGGDFSVPDRLSNGTPRSIFPQNTIFTI